MKKLWLAILFAILANLAIVAAASADLIWDGHSVAYADGVGDSPYVP